MSKRNKLFLKFQNNPQSLKYREIEALLLHAGFRYFKLKGSHIKFKHKLTRQIITIPVHNNDCKIYYKKEIAKILSKYLILILWNHFIIQLHTIIKNINIQ